MNKIKDNLHTISLLTGLLLTVGGFFYNSITLKERLSNDIMNNKKAIERIEIAMKNDINKLEMNKLDKNIFELFQLQLQRIENKLDKLQEKK